MTIFKIIGAVGLLLISAGIITKKRKTQDLFYVMGGAMFRGVQSLPWRYYFYHSANPLHPRRDLRSSETPL